MVKQMDAEEKIKELINELRPYLNIDGGDIEFVKYEKKILYVKLIGNCAHCLMQDNTLNEGILQMLHAEVPEIEDIINIDL